MDSDRVGSSSFRLRMGANKDRERRNLALRGTTVGSTSASHAVGLSSFGLRGLEKVSLLRILP